MIVRAQRGVIWFLWDCERCLAPRNVMWVNDDPPQYEQCVEPLRVEGDRVVTHIVHAKKIAIYPDRHLIFINPTEDDEPTANEVFVAIRVQPIPITHGYAPEIGA
jgi:hypothetical protein